MSLEQEPKDAYGRILHRVYCDACSSGAVGGVTKRSALDHAIRAKFYNPKYHQQGSANKWLCRKCFNEWRVHLTVHEFIREKRRELQSVSQSV